MTKFCPQCGASNADDSAFCIRCGAAQPASPNYSQPAPPPSGPSYSPHSWTPPLQKSRWERGFQFLTSNLGLIFPMLFLFIVEIILLAILAVVIVATIFSGRPGFGGFIFPGYFAFSGGIAGAIIALLVGIAAGFAIAMVTVEVSQAMQRQPFSLSWAWRRVSSRLNDVLVLSVILGVLSLLWALVPFIGWLLQTLTLMVFVGLNNLVLLSNLSVNRAFGRVFDFISQMANKDAATLVAFFIASLVSLVPVVQIFSLPYAIILAALFLSESSSFRPSPHPPTTGSRGP